MPGARYPGPPRWMLRPFPTTKVAKVMPQIPFEVPNKRIKLKSGPDHLRGPWTRMESIAISLTNLFRDERIETTYYRGYEVRLYAERLIVEAMRHGDCHRPTMEAANFFLNEKNLVHKLFKVLVPRFINYTESFTAMHFIAPDLKRTMDKHNRLDVKLPYVVLEMKGNPLPPLPTHDNEPIDSKNFLTNILLRSAKMEFDKNKK